MERNIRKVHLVKHPNGKSPNWYLRYWKPKSDGSGWKEVRQSTRTSVRKKAEQQRRDLERELEQGLVHESEISWNNFTQLFIQNQIARKPKSTVACYEFSLNSFTKMMKPQFLSEVTRSLMDQFVTQRVSEVAVATVNKDLRHLKVAMKWAEQQEYILKVPNFSGIFLKEDRKQPTYIPEEDFLKMIQALKAPNLNLQQASATWWKVYLYLAYYLGLRRGELFGLEWEDINFDILEVRVKAPTSKSRKERVVPIQPEIAEMLKDWKQELEETKPKSPVLPWPRDHFRDLYFDWHHIQDVAGFSKEEHYVPKDCRSSCASALIAAQTPTAVVQKILGHASMSTTANYYINAQPALRQAIENRPIKLEPESPVEQEPE